MQTYHMISDTDGALYDTRAAGWHNLPPVRRNYSRHHRDIKTVSDLKASLRAGGHTFPGGYPLYFITSDGESLSFEAARSEFRQIADSIRTRANDGWRVVALDVNYEDSDLVCDHTGNRIPAAYGDTDSESVDHD